MNKRSHILSMGINSSRVEFINTPSWFPTSQFAEYVSEQKKSSTLPEQILFESLERKMKEIPGIKCAKVERAKSFFFPSIHVTTEIEKTKPQPILDGITDPKIGFEIASSISHAPRKMDVAYQFFFPNQYNILLNIMRPVLSSVDFHKQHPFVETNVQMRYRKDKVSSKQLIRIASVSTGARLWDRNKTLNFSMDVCRLEKQKKQASVFYYDPQLYSKFYSTYAQKGKSTKFTCQCGTLINMETIRAVPFVKLITLLKYSFPKLFTAHLSGGALLSLEGLPVSERFHVGGIPYLRGFSHHKFSSKCGGVSTGCDYYLIGGVESCLPLLKQLDFHFYANAGVSVLTKANYFLEMVPNYVMAATYGCGYSYHFPKTNLELNFNVPIYKSPDLQFCRVQFRFYSKD